MTEPREAYINRDISGYGINRTVEPRSGLFSRERPLEYNRTITEPRSDIRRELEERERRINEPARDRELRGDIGRSQEDFRYGEAGRISQIPLVLEPTKPSVTERLKERIDDFRHPDKNRDLIRERDRDRDTGLIRDRETDLITERDLIRDRDIDTDLIRDRDTVLIRDRDLIRDSDLMRDRNLVRDRDYARAIPTEDLRIIESNRIREIPVESTRIREIPVESIRIREIPVVSNISAVPLNSSTNNEFNKPNSERIRELRGEREFPVDKYTEEPRFVEAGRNRTIQQIEIIRPSNEQLSDLRRDREFPAELSKATVDRISDIRRERELQGEIGRPEELRFSGEAAKKNLIPASDFLANNTNLSSFNNKPSIIDRISDIRREREIPSELSRREGENRLGELRRERINNKDFNRSAVPLETISDLRRDRDLVGDYGRISTEQRTSDIKQEIAEIERRVSDQKISDLRREREFPSELNRNRTEYRSSEKEVPGISDHIETVNAWIKRQGTDMSYIKRESDYEYERGYNAEEPEENKKKKNKKKKKYKRNLLF